MDDRDLPGSGCPNSITLGSAEFAGVACRIGGRSNDVPAGATSPEFLCNGGTLTVPGVGVGKAVGGKGVEPEGLSGGADGLAGLRGGTVTEGEAPPGKVAGGKAVGRSSDGFAWESCKGLAAAGVVVSLPVSSGTGFAEVASGLLPSTLAESGEIGLEALGSVSGAGTVTTSGAIADAGAAAVFGGVIGSIFVAGSVGAGLAAAAGAETEG